MHKTAAAPAFLDILRDKPRRNAAARYWIGDIALGALNLSLHYGLRGLSIDVCSAFGAANARFCPGRFPRSDERARHLWRTLRPDQDRLENAVRLIWRNAARTMAEYSAVHRMWRENRIAVQGLDQIKAARAAGRPVIIAGLHLGNWETITACVAANGIPISMTYEPPENRFEHWLVKRIRNMWGVRLVYPDQRGGLGAHRALRRGDVFTFYIDEVFRGRIFNGQVSAPFFGRPFNAAGNIGNVVRLARVADAEIFVAYATRLNDTAQFKVTFLPALVQQRTGDTDADLVANVQALNAQIEPIVREHLDQWFYALDLALPGA